MNQKQVQTSIENEWRKNNHPATVDISIPVMHAVYKDGIFLRFVTGETTDDIARKFKGNAGKITIFQVSNRIKWVRSIS